jgi:carbonic anhydrase/acetyltransferase-like protein (isoleucine patch superfamily)
MIYNLGELKPKIDKKTVWIADSADIIGDVVLEANVSVWFNVTIRGDNDTILIGQGSNVQDNTVIHTDLGIKVTIGKNVTIGHKVILHGSKIGENSIIGMGSVLMNNSIIGENCILGANSLVTEGKQFPANSLIMGSPAKVVRELSEDEIQFLKLSAEHYVEKSKLFKQDLKHET